MQIRLYIPEILHPAYGVLRALVKDSYNTANVSSHMDSDGQVGDTTVGPQPTSRHFLADGLWHMATLTTHTNMSSGLQGYIMLLDGQLGAFQAANRLYISEHFWPATAWVIRRDCMGLWEEIAGSKSLHMS